MVTPLHDRHASLPGPSYAGRAADPASGYDVATLALLRWWSETVADPTDVNPQSLPSFAVDFRRWWDASPDNRMAAVVEDWSGISPLPVAIGWVAPADDVPTPSNGTRVARVRAVHVMSGVPAIAVLDELHRALAAVARANRLVLTYP